MLFAAIESGHLGFAFLLFAIYAIGKTSNSGDLRSGKGRR